MIKRSGRQVHVQKQMEKLLLNAIEISLCFKYLTKIRTKNVNVKKQLPDSFDSWEENEKSVVPIVYQHSLLRLKQIPVNGVQIY